MDLLQWFLVFLAVQVIHFAGTWRLYEKAGRRRWEALVPVYNAVVLMRIIRRSPWWTLLLFVPIVNLIMFPVVWVQILKAFGRTSATDYLLGIITLGLYIFVVNYDDKTVYNGDLENKESTVSSLLFAIVVATLVHTYVMQPFTIPTASLEKTLLIGDFLFVSKFHYGARTPMTTIAAPMVHDSIPLTKMKSYANWPQLPYFRFPGFEKVEKNDIVVFNWPVDTVKVFRDTQTVGLRKPIDKKSNYVKRCVGTPGDVFSLRKGIVYINGQELKLSDRAQVQYRYAVTTKNGNALDPYDLYNSFGVVNGKDYARTEDGTYIFFSLTFKDAEQLRQNSLVASVEKQEFTENDPKNALAIFPHSKPQWTVDNMGDVYIPEEGKEVTLTAETLPFYKMIITEYEKNTLEINGNQFIINGKPATTYTFKQNYYWMMGDNRHNSEDSRYWGFVPEDHIVGKPVFVWMSINQNESWGSIGKKIRWDRMFTTVGGSGTPVSYFKYFVIALIGWFAFDFFRKRRKNEEKA
jgi:signal peptidase I